MTTNHFIRYYACGKHIEAQCRCMSLANFDKRREISATPCPTCPTMSNGENCGTPAGRDAHAYLRAEIDRLNARLDEAIRYLEDGHCTYGPQGAVCPSDHVTETCDVCRTVEAWKKQP